VRAGTGRGMDRCLGVEGGDLGWWGEAPAGAPEAPGACYISCTALGGLPQPRTSAPPLHVSEALLAGKGVLCQSQKTRAVLPLVPAVLTRPR